jgi:hypothetical protein
MVDSNLPPDMPSLLKGIEELRPLLERNAPQGETDRRVAQESIDALEAIGAFRVTQPAKYGGYQGNSRAPDRCRCCCRPCRRRNGMGSRTHEYCKLAHFPV